MDAIEKTPAKKKKGESAKGVRKKKDSTVNKDALNEKEMRKLEKQVHDYFSFILIQDNKKL